MALHPAFAYRAFVPADCPDFEAHFRGPFSGHLDCLFHPDHFDFAYFLADLALDLGLLFADLVRLGFVVDPVLGCRLAPDLFVPAPDSAVDLDHHLGFSVDPVYPADLGRPDSAADLFADFVPQIGILGFYSDQIDRPDFSDPFGSVLALGFFDLVLDFARSSADSDLVHPDFVFDLAAHPNHFDFADYFDLDFGLYSLLIRHHFGSVDFSAGPAAGFCYSAVCFGRSSYPDYLFCGLDFLFQIYFFDPE